MEFNQIISQILKRLINLEENIWNAESCEELETISIELTQLENLLDRLLLIRVTGVSFIRSKIDEKKSSLQK